MLEEICAEIHNWFTYRSDIYIGDYTIADGMIAPSVDFKGAEYFRIIGSRKNNGVHKVDDDQNPLIDEQEFHGSIWLMNPPKDFMLLVSDIEKWQKKYGDVESSAMSPYNSESFGGYSYSKAGAGGAGDASGLGSITWQNAFASRLKRYRRIRDL